MIILTPTEFASRCFCARCHGAGIIAASTAGPQRMCDACNGTGDFSRTPAHEFKPTPNASPEGV